jgi:SAM-dependent methyltransferase
MKKAATMTNGRVLDFGCGVGDLLKLLGNSSVGLECNSSTIKHLEARGLHAIEYDGFLDDWNLGVIPASEVFDTIVMSHFLEHFERPFEILNKVILSSRRLGVTRFLIIVPGESGFKLDKTHRYFIKKLELLDFLKSRDDVRIIHAKLFPFNFDFVSRFFPHNELQLVFEIS